MNGLSERAYEAYIWSLCKRAVEETGETAELVGRDGKPAKNIILRGAPGHMASNAQNLCYIKCRLNAKEFEIHLDVQYEGEFRHTSRGRRFNLRPCRCGKGARVYQPGIAL